MQIVAQFDPTTETDFNIATNLVNGGYFLVINESSNNLVFTMPDNTQMYIPAWTAIPVHFCKNSSSVVLWTSQSTLGGSNTSISQVTVVAFQSNEHLPISQAISLTRQTNIGNAVQTMTSTNQVNNDGNPITTIFIEATQSGNTGGSNVALGNDGSFQFAQWVASAFSKYFYGIPGATPNIVLGAKTILQALDNAGANLSNILGIDSGGNTFIQNHKGNNQTVIYDKNGSALITVYANGDITHGTRFIATPFHLTTSTTVTSGTTTTLTCTGGATGVPTTATGVIIGGGVSSSTAGAFVTLAPTGKTLGQYGGWTCQNASNQLEEFVMTIPISTGGQLDVHANAGNIVLQDWYIIGYVI